MDSFYYKLQYSKMEFCNEYIKTKLDKNLESYFCVLKIRTKHFFPCYTQSPSL